MAGDWQVLGKQKSEMSEILIRNQTQQGRGITREIHLQREETIEVNLIGDTISRNFRPQFRNLNPENHRSHSHRQHIGWMRLNSGTAGKPKQRQDVSWACIKRGCGIICQWQRWALETQMDGRNFVKCGVWMGMWRNAYDWSRSDRLCSLSENQLQIKNIWKRVDRLNFLWRHVVGGIKQLAAQKQ